MTRQKNAEQVANQQEDSVVTDADSGVEAVVDSSSQDGQGVLDNGRGPLDIEDATGEQENDESVAALREQLAAAQAKADEYLDRLQRTAAEFQNSKKRQEKQLTESIARASAHLVRRLLPVLDDLDLAFKNVPASLGDEEFAWVTGFSQIQKKLMDLLAEEGVTPIAANGEFDPNRHEAVSSEPSDEIESGHIIETLRTGYEHKGQVLRPAIVRVAA